MKTLALRRTFLLAVSAAALALLGLGGCAKSEPVKLAMLGPAPVWKLKDVDGKVVSSDQFKGKVTVVDFWATWCVPCIGEIPGYIELKKKYGDDLAIVGISMDEAGTDVVKAYMAKAGINYQIVMGNEDVVAAFGNMSAIPTTFLIDRNGQIRDRKEGALPHEEYAKRVEAALKATAG